MAKIFSKEKVINKVFLIERSKIKPNPAQPRTEFKQKELEELAQSIKENGILQPLTVRDCGNNQYELIAGERRLRASALAEINSVPCIIMDANSQKSAIYAILENLQRQDLNPIEEAAALKKLIVEWNVSQEQASLKLGMAQSTISNKMRLLKLGEECKAKIIESNLTERHARALLKINDSDLQLYAVNHIAANNLSVQETEKYIEKLQRPAEPPKKNIPIIKDVRLFLNTINHAIDTMKKSGVNAVAKKTEHEGYIEYTVKIPV